MSTGLDITLPKSWYWSPLKFATTFLNRGFAPEYVDEGPVRAISQASNQLPGLDWSRTRFSSWVGNPRRLKACLLSGDTLINSTGNGTLGRVGYFTAGPDDIACAADGHITVARADRRIVEPRYMYYWLSSNLFYNYIYSALVVGATNQIELNREALAGAPIALPPLDEQRRIANFLDAETARIDHLDELSANTMSLLRERRQALVERIIVSSSAATQKLFRCLQLLRDGTHQPPPRTGTGVPLLTARNVSSGTLRLTEADTFVSPEDAEILEGALKLRHRDVLLSVKGTIGAVAIAPPGFPRAVLDRNLALLRPTKTLLNEWLVWALRTRNVREQMQLSIAAAAQPGLPLGVIRELRIPASDLQTQKQQVAKIEQVDDQITDLESKIKSQRNLLAERRQALITAAVTGGIAV
jgi:type I restriction enzyme, S subunit